VFIKSLELNNFKRFKDLKLEFSGDITVIKGPNEQGKSSVVQAFIAAIFYDSAKSNEDIKKLQAWGSEKLYSIILGFEAQGEDYILEKDFEQKKISLKNETTEETIDDYKEVSKKLNQLGGYQSPELFFNTACVKQGELAVLDKKQTISEALGDIVSGGGASISLRSIFKRIEKAQDDLKRGLGRGLAKNPGILLRLQGDLEKNSRELEAKRRIFEEEDKARQKLTSMLSEREALKESFDVKDRMYKNAIAYFEISKVLEGLNSEHDILRKKIDIMRELESQRSDIKRNLESLREFASIDLKKYTGLAEDLENLSNEISRIEDEIKEMKKRGIKVRETINPRFLISGGILLVLGFLGTIIHPALFFSWALFGILSFWAGFSKFFFSRMTQKKLQGKLSEIRDEIRGKGDILKKELTLFRVGSVDEIEQKKKEFHDQEIKLGNISSKIEGMLGGETKESVTERIKEVEKRIAIEEVKIKEQKLRPSSREEQATLERDVERLQKKLFQMDRQVIELETLISRESAPREDIVRFEEKIFSIQEELKGARNKERVFTVLSETLYEAQQKTFSSTRKILEEYISEFLSEITEGKYSEIFIKPGMKIKVFSNEKGEEIEPEGNLSQGALEQLYLVARFALISMLYQSARPLVILDDPFGNFDQKRKAKVRQILKRLSQNFQIILLTCSDEYDKWGKAVMLN